MFPVPRSLHPAVMHQLLAMGRLHSQTRVDLKEVEGTCKHLFDRFLPCSLAPGSLWAAPGFRLEQAVGRNQVHDDPKYWFLANQTSRPQLLVLGISTCRRRDAKRKCHRPAPALIWIFRAKGESLARIFGQQRIRIFVEPGTGFGEPTHQV